MRYYDIYFDKLGVTAEFADFKCDGVRELHIILHVEPRGELFKGQLERIYAAEDTLLSHEGLEGAKCVMKRYFLSDSANQMPMMRSESDVSISYIQQQPLDGSKLAVWVYMTKGMDISNEDDTVVAEHNGYKHLYNMGICSPQGDSAQQTNAVLGIYERALGHFGATMEENCVRTWFFVRDVDTQYQGMVRARREYFANLGMTEKTHYIASTGIGGTPADTQALVQMGAYAVCGLDKGQVRYLHASTHLNPTHEYGVTFERGTVVEYGDRRHVIISGTASIDNKGRVMHVGDIVSQTERMLENVETLLSEGGASFADVAQLVVYLRDAADYGLVQKMFGEKYPDIPTVITLAPVCRPQWLIEVECLAITNHTHPSRRDF